MTRFVIHAAPFGDPIVMGSAVAENPTAAIARFHLPGDILDMFGDALFSCEWWAEVA